MPQSWEQYDDLSEAELQQCKVTICVDGPIGAGKSTMLDILKETYPEWNFIQEPVKRWMDEGILEAFYSDSKKYSYLMQSVAFIDRVRNIKEPQIEQVRISERSPLADRKCFAKNCHTMGAMSDIEWNEYTRWFDWLWEEFRLEDAMSGYIYMKCSPETCMERINKRSRGEEKNIPIEYLRDLNVLYDDMIGSLPDRKVLVLDADRDFLNDQVTRADYISKIEGFVSKI